MEVMIGIVLVVVAAAAVQFVMKHTEWGKDKDAQITTWWNKR